jgi:serine/threonine protein kinase
MRLESLPGSVLDHKYQIDRQLGKGAMGAVFQATHLGTMRTVALKVIVPKLAAEAEFTQRFKREAEAAGRLHHPNVVNVTDFGVTRVENGELAYMVMEYLDGQTLSAYLKSEPRPSFNFILDVVDQTALALDAAHRAGIVHRDLKPSNIWLEPNHRGGYNIKVLDFGIAKVSGASAAAQPIPLGNDAETIVMAPASAPDVDEPETPTLLTTPSHLLTTPSHLRTTVGTLLGTPAYMAPEQCQGAEVDFRADIYSLATIVYEMLCSRLPFQTEDYKQLVRMQVSETPQPPSERDPSVPADLSNAVMGGLAKNPADRQRSAGAFATLLRSVAEGELTPIRKSKDVFHAHTNCLFPILLGDVAIVLTLAAPFWVTAHVLYGAKAASQQALILAVDLVFFTLMFFGGQLYKAASFMVLQDAAEKGQFLPRARAVLSALIRGLPALLRTYGVNLLQWSPRSFRENLLWPIVWAREGRSGRDGLERSRQLCGSLSAGTLTALVVRQIAPAALGVLLFPSIMSLTTGRLGLQFIVREELAGSRFGIFCLVYPLFFMLFYVNFGAASTFLYWTALQSRGEAGGDVILPGAIRDEKRRGSRGVRPATLIWGAIPFVMVAMLLFKIAVLDSGSVMEDALNDGRRAAVLKALNSGLSVDYRDSGDETPLFEAVRVADNQLVEALLSRGANVNARNRNGSSALIQAAVYDRQDLARLLLDHGAALNAVNNDGRTALMIAAMRGNLPMVQLLLGRGADSKRTDSHGKTALSYAQEEGYAEIAALLHG